jgi:hypothetical protein
VIVKKFLFGRKFVELGLLIRVDAVMSQAQGSA